MERMPPGVRHPYELHADRVQSQDERMAPPVGIENIAVPTSEKAERVWRVAPEVLRMAMSVQQEARGMDGKTAGLEHAERLIYCLKRISFDVLEYLISAHGIKRFVGKGQVEQVDRRVVPRGNGIEPHQMA
jgi:hypothetical protein